MLTTTVKTPVMMKMSLQPAIVRGGLAACPYAMKLPTMRPSSLAPSQMDVLRNCSSRLHHWE
jgi:hypothetical protein